MRSTFLQLRLLLFLLLGSNAPTDAAPSALAARGMVASGHPLATQAGVDVLRSGGNAIDAAVAVGLTLAVVDTANSGIGGGCFMLIRLANGKIVAIDGRETAPAAATRDMFLRNGKAVAALSQTGALASGVPGELAAFDHAVRHHGRKTLADLLRPAAEIAEKGFEVSHSYASRLRSVADEMRQFPASIAVFYRDGEPVRAGELLKQTDLARTYREIATRGIGWFYGGPFAVAVEDWMRVNGGLMCARDLASYQAKLRKPLESEYRGYRIVSFPPPSSGGVHVAQMLNMLEHFNLRKMDESARLHVMVEAMKLAFADRAYWLGDPDFVNVPRGLVSQEYAAMQAKSIDPQRAAEVPSHGQPPDWEDDLFGKHTTHFSVADAEGNWVACTATINTSFGSKVVIPGTGVVLNNEMDDFSAQLGVPNHFGLVGAEANAVAPGKRPLSSMSPTLVFKHGQPVMALGAAGGPKIITTVLQELVSMIDLGMTPAEALAAPRIHHQWSPATLVLEESLPDSLKESLRSRGHELRIVSAGAVSQIVARTPDGKAFIGAADPRSGGAAAGW